MTLEPQKNNSAGIIIAIIGVIGAVIAAVITVAGDYNVEKMRQEAELTKIALAPQLTQSASSSIKSPVLNTIQTLASQNLLTTTSGDVVWQSAETILENTGIDSTLYLSTEYSPTDFVLYSEIIWNSLDTEGTACGFFFRSNDRNYDYSALLRKNGNALLWRTIPEGVEREIASSFIDDINKSNNTVNKLILIAQNNKFVLLVNNIIAIEGTDNSYKQGSVGIITGAGHNDINVCTFRNSWLWEIK